MDRVLDIKQLSNSHFVGTQVPYDANHHFKYSISNQMETETICPETYPYSPILHLRFPFVPPPFLQCVHMKQWQKMG